MKNLGQMLKQVGQMQAKMAEMQAALEAREITGEAGGGMVSIVLNGKSEVKKIRLDPKIVDPAEVGILEDLILAAWKDGKAKVDKEMAEEMSKMTGGLPLPPGMKFPF